MVRLGNDSGSQLQGRSKGRPLLQSNMGKQLKVLYDCDKCTGYCCSYPLIELYVLDIKRLAKHLGLTNEEFLVKHTKAIEIEGEEGVGLRMKADPIYGQSCRFLDLNTRKCKVYDGRPDVCRDYPYSRRCGYYQFLTFERKRTGNPDAVAFA